MARRKFAEFKEETLTIVSPRKTYAKRIVIEIGNDGTTTASYVIEREITLGTTRTSEYLTTVRLDMNNTNEYPMLDVDTGLPTGNTVTDRKLEQILFSKYMASPAQEMIKGVTK